MKAEYPETPRLAAGGVVIHRNRVLLVRRQNPPAAGEWAIPGGRVELGESLAAAVERELSEETGILVQAEDICHVFESIEPDANQQIRFHYVIVDLWARYLAGDPRARSDAAAAAWFTATELAHQRINQHTLALLKKLGFIASI